MKKLLSLLLCLVTVLALTACGSGVSVKINEENFPDEQFRDYVKTNFDKNHNGVLNAKEIKNAKRITLYKADHVASVKGVEYFTALTYLVCSGCGLTELDVSGLAALNTLVCSENALTKLDVSNNTRLEALTCSGNALTEVDVSNNTALIALECNGNQLTKLDVSNNIGLKSLRCDGNQLKSLDISANTKLTQLWCQQNQLKSLDVSSNTALKELWCEENQLTKLYIGACPYLVDIYTRGEHTGGTGRYSLAETDKAFFLSFDETVEIVTGTAGK